MKKEHTILVVAPHPDDETLGCGGAMLRHRDEGDELHWMQVTDISAELGYSAEKIAARTAEVNEVAARYRATIHKLGLPTTRLDTLAKSDLIARFARVFGHVRPDTIYLPYRNDAHSDHGATFDAAIACCKTFRHPYVKRVYVYETLSETEFGLRTDDSGFRPNLFIDIAPWLEEKVAILRMYDGEMAPFPFPRSVECVRAQSMLRGSQAGCHAAEAFMTLKEVR